ncbi:MAG: 50S ribosomal protein L24 [Nitrososphaerales archaeon]|nr:50S ribosomal protein L24 [Nitrososphaerales archaeon]
MSSKPRKVRKRLYEAPHHIKSSQVCAPLSKELREKYGVKSLRVRKGDMVKVMRGTYKGVEGKVTEVDVESGRVAIEGITREKVGGGTVPVMIHASKVMITSINLDDKWRRMKLEKSAPKVSE